MNDIRFDKNIAVADLYAYMTISNYPWLRTVTGETVFVDCAPSPDNRKHFSEYGCSVFMPTDSHAPKLYTPEGIHIPAAQLEHRGQPYLLWDHAQNMVVEIRHGGVGTQVPSCFRRFAVYWSAHDSRPVGSPITYLPPNKFTPEELSFVRQLKPAAIMEAAVRRDGGSWKKEAEILRIDQSSLKAEMERGATPASLVNKFNLQLLETCIESPASIIRRTGVTIPYAITKA